MDAVLASTCWQSSAHDLRIRPKAAPLPRLKSRLSLAQRKAARADKDFARSDALRDELAGKGVEVMDGDPLGWEWRIEV
jgi:cysteinyl-tRNA synthetase